MKKLIAALAAITLSACGGGGDGEGARMQEGLYLSKDPMSFINGARTDTVLVLDLQETWVFGAGAVGYGRFEPTGPTLFIASNALAIPPGSTSGELQSGQVMTIATEEGGTVLRPGEPPEDLITHQLIGRPTLVTPATGYDYNKPARLEDVAGTYGGVTVGNTGTLSGKSQMCTVSGVLAPRPGGKNVFNVAFTLADCDGAGTYTGVAVTFLDGPQFTVPSLRLLGINASKSRIVRYSAPTLI